MIIEIIDERTVEVYGSTPEEAHSNMMEFYNTFIGKGNWKSMDGYWAGISYKKGMEFKYRLHFIRLFPVE